MSSPEVSVERRRSERYPFTAGVLALEPGSGARIDAHSSDLSLGGCYVDTMNPLPTGTEVEIRLTKDGRTFHAKARVAHYQVGIGMGLLFTSVELAQLAPLESWFAELHGESDPAQYTLESDAEAFYGTNFKDDERYALEELLVLLMRKGLLTEEEGEPILKRLMH